MASSDLEEIFARFGWAMIERNAGCEAFRAELAGGRREDAEVLLVAETATGTGTTSAPGARVSLGKVVTRTADELSIELESGPGIDGYLDDHKLDGVPVLPMAAAVELLCETAQTFAPDMTLGYLENLDIPSGIMFDSGRKTLLLSAKVESRSKSKLALNLSISTRAQEGTRTNFRARAVLSPAPERVFPDSLPARYQEPSLVQPSEQLPTPSEIYERILFHGPIFQGIVELSGMGIDGAFGAIRTVPSTECVTGAASEWMVDPVLLDSAMQIAGVWGREFLDVTMLPTGMKCFRILSPRKGRHFKALVTTKPESQGNELLCDLAVYNADGEMVMAMEGLTAVGSKSLNRLAGRTGR